MTKTATVFRWNDFPRRDRLWLGIESTFAVATGPAEMPSVEAARTVIRQLATIDPSSRFTRRIDAARGARVPVPLRQRERFLSAVVVDLDDSPAAIGEPVEDSGPLLARLAELCEEGLGDLPFRIFVGQRCSFLMFSHLLGDYTCLKFWAGVLRHALEGSRPTDLVGGGTRYPLPRALRETYGRRPALLRDLAASMRERHEVPAGRLGFLGGELPGGKQLELGEFPGGEQLELGKRLPAQAAAGPRPAAGGVGRLLQRSRPGYLATLRAWRDLHAPGVSVNSVLFAATMAAMDAAGLGSADDGIHLPCDLRRYLRVGAPTFGNFVERLTIWPDDPTSPESFGAELRRATELGQPLARQAFQIAKSWLPRPRPQAAAPPAAPDVRPWLVSWGREPELERLRWLAPPEERFFANARSGGKDEGISFIYLELAGVLHVRAQFDERRYDPVLVNEALNLLCTDPIKVLNGQSGQRA
ncbi:MULTISPECIES: hypothetical protein [Pseudofrankia]|uniref:hypothetical protein n=1 Tax=Pseudofrankia TaxID=2994363 RepID=UPI000234D5C4|nr:MULTISPECIES: hypothetical protein [Pseudofrankia]OHV39853.1 hypothetical protein BCD49_09610 [Pseudofrankia sp. EUN1h]